MDIKKFSDFTVLQKFTVLNYYMWPVDETDDLDTFKIAGDNGFPNKYRIEVKFLETQYISAPTTFPNKFTFRYATEEEKTTFYSNFT
ncbi:hypothetical protein ccbrp13_61280 [Ktedonobacteria bacterium brp13]|nr:hypothetical protein ccbrp13_61280 [Ktedonobacteria bacterium brp13]